MGKKVNEAPEFAKRFPPTIQSNNVSSTDREQKAKDLLWKYIDEDNKKLLLTTANTNALESNGLELKNINISYQYK
jgi:hypothetical protein